MVFMFLVAIAIVVGLVVWVAPRIPDLDTWPNDPKWKSSGRDFEGIDQEMRVLLVVVAAVFAAAAALSIWAARSWLRRRAAEVLRAFGSNLP